MRTLQTHWAVLRRWILNTCDGQYPTQNAKWDAPDWTAVQTPSDQLWDDILPTSIWLDVSFRMNVEEVICWTLTKHCYVSHCRTKANDTKLILKEQRGSGMRTTEAIFIQSSGCNIDIYRILIYTVQYWYKQSTETNPVCSGGRQRLWEMTASEWRPKGWAGAGKGGGSDSALSRRNSICKGTGGINSRVWWMPELPAVWCCRNLNRRVRNGGLGGYARAIEWKQRAGELHAGGLGFHPMRPGISPYEWWRTLADTKYWMTQSECFRKITLVTVRRMSYPETGVKAISKGTSQAKRRCCYKINGHQ